MGEEANVDLIRETSLSVVGEVVNVVVGFVGVIIFARLFSTTSFGLAYLTIAIGVIVHTIPNGLGIAVKKRTAEQITDVIPYTTATFVFIGAYFLLLIAVVWFGSPFITLVLPHQFAYAGIGFVLGRSTLFAVKQAYAGTGSPGKATWLDSIDGVLTFILRLSLISAGGGAISIVYGAAFSGLVVGIVAYFIMFGRVELPTKSHILHLVTFARWSIPNFALKSGYRQTPMVIIGTLIGASVAAQYETALKLAMPGVIIAGTISSSMIVKTSSEHAQGNSLTSIARESISTAGIISLPILVGSLLLGDTLMRVIFGSQYANTGHTLALVALIKLFVSYEMIFLSVINGADSPRNITLINLIRITVYLPLHIAVAYFFGFFPYLVMFVVTRVLDAAALWYITTDIVQGPLFNRRRIAAQIKAVILMGGVVIGLQQFLSPTLLPTIVAVISGGIVYTTTLLAYSPAERQLAEQVWNKFISV